MFAIFSSYYPIVFVLQAFCLFHAYRNNNHQKWYWLIIFVPLIGSLIYLYENFYNRRNIANLSEGVKGLLNSDYTIKKLESEVKFTATVNNKIALADAYTERGRFSEAQELYESCLQNFSQNNPELLRKMLRVHFLQRNYQETVELGKRIPNSNIFNQSEEKIAYAWALHHMGNSDAAEKVFDEMDIRFSNFKQRLEYAKFLHETQRTNEGIRILGAMTEEFENMDSYEKSLKRPIMADVKSLRNKWR